MAAKPLLRLARPRWQLPDIHTSGWSWARIHGAEIILGSHPDLENGPESKAVKARWEQRLSGRSSETPPGPGRLADDLLAKDRKPMTDTDHPTASTRPHVIDMFHAALTTLPRGGPGGPEPSAGEALAIDPELGSPIC